MRVLGIQMNVRWAGWEGERDPFFASKAPASIFMFIFQVHISLIILHNSYHLSTRILPTLCYCSQKSMKNAFFIWCVVAGRARISFIFFSVIPPSTLQSEERFPTDHHHHKGVEQIFFHLNDVTNITEPGELLLESPKPTSQRVLQHCAADSLNHLIKFIKI